MLGSLWPQHKIFINLELNYYYVHWLTLVLIFEPLALSSRVRNLGSVIGLASVRGSRNQDMWLLPLLLEQMDKSEWLEFLSLSGLVFLLENRKVIKHLADIFKSVLKKPVSWTCKPTTSSLISAWLLYCGDKVYIYRQSANHNWLATWTMITLSWSVLTTPCFLKVICTMITRYRHTAHQALLPNMYHDNRHTAHHTLLSNVYHDYTGRKAYSAHDTVIPNLLPNMYYDNRGNAHCPTYLAT